jgi:hypothetical protein
MASSSPASPRRQVGPLAPPRPFSHVVAGLAALVALSVAIPARGDAQKSTGGIPARLEAAIRALHPDATVVQATDIDLMACEYRKSPGLVTGDFNGDGRPDYATLLRVGPIKEVAAEGRTLKVFSTWFVVFLDLQSELKSIIIEQGGAYYPSLEAIALQPAGSVREAGEGATPGRTIRLRYPAIKKTFCDKPAAVYYWNRDRAAFSAVLAVDAQRSRDSSLKARDDEVVCSRLVIRGRSISCGRVAGSKR